MRPVIAPGLALLVFPGVSAMQDPWDFVPGEKLPIYDDFSDMPKGGAPPHWKVRGATLRLVDGDRGLRLWAADGGRAADAKTAPAPDRGVWLNHRRSADAQRPGFAPRLVGACLWSNPGTSVGCIKIGSRAFPRIPIRFGSVPVRCGRELRDTI